MSASQNRELVWRRIEEDWNANDNERVMRELFAEDWIDGDDPAAPRGREGVRAFVEIYRTALPDVHIEIHQVVADDQFVAFRWTAHGTPRRTTSRRPCISANHASLPGIRCTSGTPASALTRRDGAKRGAWRPQPPVSAHPNSESGTS